MRPSTLFLLMAVLASGLCLGPVAANEPAPRALQVPDSTAPTFSVYSSRDGLGDEIWSTLGAGPDGFVWAGSASRLARFDGYRWSEPAPAPGRSLVRDMANDADGNLWAIFESEGLVRFDGSRWQRVGPARFHQRFATIGTAADTELWVAHNQGLARLVDGEWVEDAGNPTVRQGRAISVARTHTLFGGTREWLGTADNGLWFREATADGAPGAWQRFEDAVLDDFAVTDLLVSHDGGTEELWVLSYGDGIARLRADGIRRWRAKDGELPSEAIYSAVQTFGPTGERSIWVASRAGLIRFRGEQVEVFNRRHGLPADAIRGLKVQRGSDGFDTLWIATENGIARAVLTDSPWHTVSLLGANENGSFGMLLEPNGRGGERLWVGSAKEGLALLDEGQWRRFPAGENQLPDLPVRGLWRLSGADGKDHRLVSLMGAPLVEISDALQFRLLDTPWPVTPDASINHLISRTVDAAVEWWVATSHSGAWRLRNGRWTQFANLGGERVAAVNWIASHTDSQGRAWLWAADSLGLARFDGVRWDRLPQSLGLPIDGFRSLTVISDRQGQTLWASSTHHGLLRLDIDDALHPRRLDDRGLPPPPDPTIYSLLADSQGRLYVCTNNGVQQLTPLEAGGYSERVFRRRDGLVHDECNTNSQFVDRRDRYWVGTLGGLGMFDPQSQPPEVARSPKPLHVTELRVDGTLQAIPDSLRISLPARARELRLEYSLLTGQREGETRYRSQLVGYDDSAGQWSEERSRVFSALPPGDYRMRIEAQDYAGTAALPLEFHIEVTPQWWQRPWLQALVAALVLLLTVAAVLAYNRGLRSREKQLRHQVAERTQDLHSANLRLTELSYLDPLTGIANRRRLIEAMRSEMDRAQAQGKPIGLIVADVDHFKAYNDRFGHLAGDAALRAIAGAMGSAMREQDLVARFGGEEFACLMVDAPLETVLRVAERMRALVEALPPRSLGNDSQTLTLSAGVLSLVPDRDQAPEALLHLADLALYDAKAAGRNRVLAAQPRADR